MSEAAPGPSRGPSAPFDRLRWAALGLSVVAFFVATALPVGRFHDTDGTPVEWSGVPFLVWGWCGPMLHGSVCGWYANPVLMLGWTCLAFRRHGLAVAFHVLSFIVALSSFSLFRVEVWQNEGGVNNLTLQSFSFGFYLWLFAIVAPLPLAALGAVRDLRGRR